MKAPLPPQTPDSTHPATGRPSLYTRMVTNTAVIACYLEVRLVADDVTYVAILAANKAGVVSYHKDSYSVCAWLLYQLAAGVVRRTCAVFLSSDWTATSFFENVIFL
jgi:hypothetical protein